MSGNNDLPEALAVRVDALGGWLADSWARGYLEMLSRVIRCAELKMAIAANASDWFAFAEQRIDAIESRERLISFLESEAGRLAR